MAKDFNIYQWRRQQLVENQVSEEKKSWKKDFEEIMNANDLTKGEIMDFISVYFKDEKGKPNMVGLNEEENIMASSITFEDLAKYGATRLPWDPISGAWLEATQPKAFEEWKDRFIRIYGDSKLEVKNGRLHPVGNEKWDQFSKSGMDVMRSSGPLD